MDAARDARRSRAAPLGLLVVALAGCHFHRDVNAPGVVDPLAPPRSLSSSTPEYPEDPGEHRLMLTTGVVGGGGGGSIERASGFGEIGAEVTVSYGQSDATHNDHAMNLLPKGVVVPPTSYGMTLGWSGLRFVKDKTTAETDVTAGPLYVEAQKSWGFYGFGGGWALDPRSGATGPQVQGFFAIYYLRSRVLFGTDGGWEIGGGIQLKLPTTVTWRRR